MKTTEASEIAILEEAQRILVENELPSEHREATDRWALRLLQRARENLNQSQRRSLIERNNAQN